MEKEISPRRIKFYLKKARNLIEGGWTRSAYARNKDGKAVPYNHSSACRFCLLGAVYRSIEPIKNNRDQTVLHIEMRNALESALKSNLSAASRLDLVGFNDYCVAGKSQVLDLFDEAIEGIK